MAEITLKLDLDYKLAGGDKPLPRRSFTHWMITEAFNFKYKEGSKDSNVRRPVAALRDSLQDAIDEKKDEILISVLQLESVLEALKEWSAPPTWWSYLETLISYVRETLEKAKTKPEADNHREPAAVGSGKKSRS